MQAIVNYFSESVREFGKINWPSRAQTLRLTLAVIVFSAVLSVFMFTVDLGLNELVKRLIVR